MNYINHIIYSPNLIEKYLESSELSSEEIDQLAKLSAMEHPEWFEEDKSQF